VVSCSQQNWVVRSRISVSHPSSTVRPDGVNNINTLCFRKKNSNPLFLLAYNFVKCHPISVRFGRSNPEWILKHYVYCPLHLLRVPAITDKIYLFFFIFFMFQFHFNENRIESLAACHERNIILFRTYFRTAWLYYSFSNYLSGNFMTADRKSRWRKPWFEAIFNCKICKLRNCHGLFRKKLLKLGFVLKLKKWHLQSYCTVDMHGLITVCPFDIKGPLAAAATKFNNDFGLNIIHTY